ncbi:MAG: hypothetical protein WCF99_00565 [Chloroflexales bacterium]
MRHLIDSGYRDANSEELEQFERLRLRYQRLARPYVEILHSWCQDRLNRYENGETLSDGQGIDLFIGRFSNALDNIVTLLPEYLTAEQRQALLSRANSLAAHWKSTLRLTELQAEVSKLWERADLLEKSDPSYVLNEILRPALDKINAAIQHSEGWPAGARDGLVLLRDQARRRYDDMRYRHEIPTTRQQGGELVKVIVDFADLARRNPSELVTYFVDDDLSSQAQSMEVAQALGIARRRLVNLVWSEKVDEYIRSAEQQLAAHRPREALAVLRSWQALPGLDDERVGVSLPRIFQNRIADSEARITTEVDRLAAAERLFSEASAQPDPIRAYVLIEEGRRIYPQAADLATLIQVIGTRAVENLTELLDNAEVLLRSEDWSLMGTRLMRVEELVRLDVAYPTSTRDRYARLHRAFDLVQPLTQTGRDRLSREAERALLEELKRELDMYWPNWQRAQHRLSELQASIDIQSLVALADRIGQPAARVDELEELRDRCVEIQADPPNQLSAEDTRALDDTKARIDAWLGFALARDELARLSLDNEMDDDLAVFAPPDLKVARDGINQARRNAKAGAAIREHRLAEHLNQLERDDAPARQALAELQDVLNHHDHESLRVALTKVGRWLRKATSYRSDFLVVRRELQQIYIELVEQELHYIVAASRASYYVDLNVGLIERLLTEAGTFVPAHSLGGTVEVPLVVIKAERCERDERQGLATWEDVRQAWEEAARLAASDEDLRRYCGRRSLQATKQSNLMLARQHSDPAATERVLRSLCEDLQLRNDPEVWFHHGSHCLRTAQQILRTTNGAGQETSAALYFDWARNSLGRASQLIAGKPQNEITVKIDQLIAEREQWQLLADLYIDLTDIGIGMPIPSLADVRRLMLRYTETAAALGDYDLGELLKRTWRNRISALRSAINTKLNETQDLFQRIDLYSTLLEIDPQDSLARNRLVGLMMEVVQKVSADIQDVKFDITGERFCQRYIRQTRQEPPSEQIAGLQLAETKLLFARVRELRTGLTTLADQLASSGITDQTLLDQEAVLVDWADQLNELHDSLDLARRLIEDGLRAPEQFDKARYVLRIGGAGGTTLRRVPQAFIDGGHPTYRTRTLLLQDHDRRRREQAEWREQIELCLQHELVITSGELDRVDTTNDHVIVARLRQGLRAHGQPRYPIEEAHRLMQEMRRSDQKDSCGLQESFIYTDPDDPGRRYQSLQLCEEVLSHKVEQIVRLRSWLAQYQPDSDHFVGGVASVNWRDQRERIERLRDSGPQELSAARTQLDYVLNGERDKLYHGRLALRATAEALTQQAMFAYLYKSQREQGPDKHERDVKLYGAARGLDREREALRQYFEKAAQEAQELLSDIDQRIRNYELTWQSLTQAYHGLIRQRRNWANSHDWRNFDKQASVFDKICPSYSPFQQMLQEVYNLTGLDHPARKRRQ